jgi:glycosyltransferase involved in cell wall biosynthesis
VAALAAGLSIPIVRSLYEGEAPAPRWRERFLLGRRAARIILFSDRVRSALLGPPWDLDEGRVVRLDPPIDLERFDPDRPLPDLRKALGIAAGVFTAGIIARLQTHRRFEILFEAIARARSMCPGLRFVVIGRGTHAEAVAQEPVRRLGLEGTVHLAGYLSGDQYVGALKALDAAVFLVPGSDGTCRAVREELAMGLPVIAARRGMLPELVRHGQTGLVVEDTPEGLAAALAELARDPLRRAAMSQAAREDARARFSLKGHAQALARIYREVLSQAERSAAGGLR